MSKYTITAALPYANGPLHLGHVAGVYLPADIFARFSRLKGDDVLFVCGSDEHGAAITLRAKMEHITPREIIDKYHEINKKAFQKFNISFDIYHRTSSEIHHKTASEFFLQLEKDHKFVKKQSQQLFDEEYNQFLADRYITGECPKCGNPGAYGDQCEKCGTSLSPDDLINPVSTLSGKKPIRKETFHWYLPMEKHEEWLKDWIQKGTLNGQQQHDPKRWRKQVIGQCMSWIDNGLQPRAMTRDLDWGVKVPLDGAEGKVLYVWLDAPIGYISATKEWALKNGKNWEDYWKDEERKLVHFIGKDNIVFHCIIFPILLKEHGEFILPDNVPAYEFLNLEGNKFSTSRDWAVWLHQFIENYPQRIDELKYTLTALAPESRDSEFTWKEFQSRVNNELVAIFGNFINRTLVLTHKYYEGVVPAPNELLEEDQEVLQLIRHQADEVDAKISQYRLREAQAEAMKLARVGNKYLADQEPWKQFKTNPDRVATILYVANQIAAALGIIFEPFIPGTAAQLRSFTHTEITTWDQLQNTEFSTPGLQIEKPELLFTKVEDELVTTEVEKLNTKKQNVTPTKKYSKVKKDIDFDTFMKMDIRTGIILEAKKVEKADKLLELLVDTGIDKRTIVSGIAEHYNPEEIIGKKVSVLMNLPAKKLRGVMSNGMILMAEDENGILSFVAPDKPFGAGCEIR